MTKRKPRKTVEIILRVSVPASWSVAHAKREATSQWYGNVYAIGPEGRDLVLRPRWGKARLVPRG